MLYLNNTYNEKETNRDLTFKETLDILIDKIKVLFHLSNILLFLNDDYTILFNKMRKKYILFQNYTFQMIKNTLDLINLPHNMFFMHFHDYFSLFRFSMD